MFFGPRTFDPVLIIAQIIAMQCLWYISLGCLLWLLLGPYTARLSLHHFFDWSYVSFRSFEGWMIIIAITVNALAASAYLVVVVERAKKCLDFAATLYLIHFIVCFAYSGFSRSLAWWVSNFVGLAITAVLGEYLCLRREMQDIPLGAGARRRGSNSGTEMVSLRAGTLPSPAVTPRVESVSGFQLKFPGSISAARAGSAGSSKVLAGGIV